MKTKSRQEVIEIAEACFRGSATLQSITTAVNVVRDDLRRSNMNPLTASEARQVERRSGSTFVAHSRQEQAGERTVTFAGRLRALNK